MIRKKSSRKGKEVTGDSSESLDVIVSNEYLLTEILLRVPAKSLMRFKCVAKHWRSLISDPKFCSIHTLQNPSSLISGICFYFNPWSLREQIKFVSPHSSTESFPKVFLPNLIPNIQMIHACNGLVLWKKDHSSANPKIYIVCNFTTQEYRALPEIGGFSLSHALPACLAFDPSKSLQYKVVLVKHNYEGTLYEIDIYSSITGSWKRVFISEAPSTGTPLGHIAFWNGSVHWLNQNMFHLKFEADAERLTSFPLPPRYMSLHDYCFMYFGECGGHLYYIVSKSYCPMNVSVLEMEPDRCCWIVKYEVELRFSISLSPNPFCYFLVLGVVNTKYSDALVLAIRPGKVVNYDLKSKKMKVLCVFPPRDLDEIYLYFAYAFQFIVSLSPV